MDAREVANEIVFAIQKARGKITNAEAIPPERGVSDKVEVGLVVDDTHFFITIEEG